jgi:hypothetical protein
MEPRMNANERGSVRDLGNRATLFWTKGVRGRHLASG